MGNTKKRKDEHLDIALRKESQYSFGSGFDRVHLLHCSIPEMDFNDVNLSRQFLGKKIDYPFIIVGMTGGTKEGECVNKAIAKVAQKYHIPMGLGSQRTMIENSETVETYYVRDVAPDIPLIGNLGAVQIKKYDTDKIIDMIRQTGVDALAVHLNPLQEIIQPEGDHDFTGVLGKIKELAKSLKIPIIVKETGAGISEDVAKKIKQTGAKYVDISGAGGTSWSKIEYQRSTNSASGFENWGIPTLRSLLMVRGIMPTIASGGLRSGIDIIKSVVLGADLGGAAYPFLKSYYAGTLETTIRLWIRQMQITAFLTGAKTYKDLKNIKYYLD